jgi:hypothetical protein
LSGQGSDLGQTHPLHSLLCSLSFLFYIDLNSSTAVSRSKQNWDKSTENSHILSPPLLSIPHRVVVPLSQLMDPWNLHWYITHFTVYIRFRLGVGYSVGLDRCIMICVLHYSIIQSSSNPPQILCAPPNSLQLLILYCLHSFALL